MAQHTAPFGPHVVRFSVLWTENRELEGWWAISAPQLGLEVKIFTEGNPAEVALSEQEAIAMAKAMIAARYAVVHGS